jgi:cytochrome o ubiquinol oxidase subunit 1
MMGMTRRLDFVDPTTGFHSLLIVAAVGACIIGLGMFTQFIQLVVSIKNRKHHRDTTGDYWNGRTLEWSTTSPAPFYNFATLPHAHGRDAFWVEKQNPDAFRHPTHFDDIHLPKNSSVGLFIAVFAGASGFAIVWHIWWLLIVGLIGIAVTLIRRSFVDETEYVVPATVVQETEARRHHL